MTKRVEKYLKMRKMFTFDLLKNDEDKYNELSQKLVMLRHEMTITELESMESSIPCREFHSAIMPIIKQKQKNPISDNEIVATLVTA